MRSRTPPPSELPPNFDENNEFDILEWSPKEIARQFTLIDFDLFTQIHPRECLLGCNKEEIEIKAPNIARVIHRFNGISKWVCKMIVQEELLSRRCRMLQCFIDILKNLIDLKNYSSSMAIYAGLKETAIYRLKKTWEFISDDHKELFEECGELLSVAQKFKNLREALKLVSPPCIPYFGIFMSDLATIETCNREFIIEEQLININKKRICAKIIKDIRRLQQTKYSFIQISYLRKILTRTIFEALWDNETSKLFYYCC